MIEKLKNISLFECFPDEELKELEKYISVIQCKKGDVIIKEGTVGDATYIIDEGEVEILRKDKLLTILSNGNIFGEMAFFEGIRRSADVIARIDTTLLQIKSKDFKEFITNHPTHGVQFLFKNIQYMTGRLRQTSNNFVTVFETGKIVGGSYTVNKMSELIISKLIEDIDDVTGGMIVILNPFTDIYDVAYEQNMKLLSLDKSVELIGRYIGQNITYQDEKGVGFGVALWNEDKILGYIFLEKEGIQEPFSKDQEILVSTVSNQICMGILKAYNTQEEEARKRLERGRMRGY
jgi:CRP-like cAMP-binding protein